MLDTAKNSENTILKTSKSCIKCPILEGSNTQILQEMTPLQERSLIKGFQHRNTHTISEETGCKRHLKRKKIPNYRLINNYFKSTRQYWKERNRRKQAWKLYSEGYKQTQIAAKLSVSTKTVSHDLRKVSSYYTGQYNREIRLVREAHDAEFMERLNGLSITDQLKQLKQITKMFCKVKDIKKKTQSTINIIFDIDEMLRVFVDHGEPDKSLITFTPNKLYTRLSDLRIHFKLRVADELLGYRTLTLSD